MSEFLLKIVTPRNKLLSMLKYLPIFLVIISQPAMAQSETLPTVSGLVKYSTNISLENHNYESSDTLLFNRIQSLFKWKKNQKEGKMTIDSGVDTEKNISEKEISEADIRQQNFYQVTKDSLYSRIFVLSQSYLLKEKKPPINWNITDSTKIVNGYLCTKATTHFRGRNYTAWFTPEIPTPFGPWKLIGLPGLVIEARSIDNKISFSAHKIELYNQDNYPGLQLSLNGKEKEITLAQYKKKLNTFGKKIRKQEKVRAAKKARQLRRKLPNANISVESKVFVPESIEIFADSTDQ